MDKRQIAADEAQIARAKRLVDFCEDPHARRHYRELDDERRDDVLSFLRASNGDIEYTFLIACRETDRTITPHDIDVFQTHVSELRDAIERNSIIPG